MRLPLNRKPLCFLDTETTGLNAADCEILSIAIRTVTCDGAVFDWEALVMPAHPEKIHPKAKEVNGFDEEVWRQQGAKPFSAIAEVVKSRLDDVIIAGWNPKFDCDFLNEEFKRLGIETRYGYHAIDGTALAWEHLVPLGLGSVSLVNVCKFLRVDFPAKAHSAMGDVLRCQRVFEMLARATWLDRMRWRWWNRG